MCSEFQINMTPKEIEKKFGVAVKNSTGEIVWEKTIRIFSTAPVIRLGKDGPEISEFVFPKSPFPNSRLSGFENQTDGNDDVRDEGDRQITRIYDKPRWMQPFAETPCLVPMTSFTEFAYWGENAGQALAFTIPNEDIFFAAALAIKPFAPKTNKTNGFSILTHTATEQMLAYHQRLIVLLKAKHALAYLEDMTSEERFQFLIKNRWTGHLNVRPLRTMVKGWDKRTPLQKAKLHREERYRSVLKAEHVEG